MSLLPGRIKDRAAKKDQPQFTQPMLATLTDDYFSDPNWIYERKLDGERCLVVSTGKTVTLYSRNKKKLNSTYPELVDAFLAQDASGYIVDGEIVAFEGNVTSFSKLQQRMQKKGNKNEPSDSPTVYFYIFDVCYAEGHDLSRLPLKDRKSVLKNLLNYNDPLRLTGYRREEGEKYHREACQKGWEGVIAKRFDSPYRHSRSKDWLKFKCVNQQELVIVGFTDPRGERPGFGALLVGYYDNTDLRYAGKVGTGYDHDTLLSLRDRMDKLQRKSPPVVDDDIPTRGVHWIKPKLVGQFGFTEWTDDGRLRHPRFLGLRRDKPASKVTRETPHS